LIFGSYIRFHGSALGPAIEQAATLPTVAGLAWQALVDAGKLQARYRVFVNGCLGNVGRCALQIARLYEAEVSGTCSKGGIAEAKSQGANKAVDYKTFEAEQLRGEFDIVLEASGNLSTSQCSTMLRDKGVALHINPTFPKMFRVMLTPHNKLVFLKTNPQLLSKVG
jgi:NADPH:quinone reductase-like Zn-dependent oxidoreductase